MSEEFEVYFDDVAVILLAAGSGERLGARRPKAFVGVAGQVMLAHSLRVFEAHEAVDSIILVIPEDWVGPTEILIDDLGCDKVSSIEIGGPSRAASVQAGLAAVANRAATAVLVHDAARPIISEAIIDRVLAPISDGWDAVVPAIDVTDTIKLIDDKGAVVQTLERSKLKSAQTPQCVRASVLHQALDELDDDALASITDDAMAAELVGGKVLTVHGDTNNIKITTPEDLAFVQAQLMPEDAVLQSVDADDDSGEDPEDLEPLDDDDLAGANDER